MHMNKNTQDTIFSTQQISFDKQSPLYAQVVNLLEEAINRGQFKTGFLPSERELAKSLNISRVTINKAFDILEKKNLIFRQQGIGTKLNRSIGYSLNQSIGFTERMANKGLSVSNQWLNREIRPAPADVAQKLNIPPETPTAYLKRVRLINNLPSSVESTYIPEQFLPEPEKLTGSLYLYWAMHDIYITNKSYQINAINCDKITADLLNQPENIALLKIDEISMDKDRNVLEYSSTLCLGDAYQFNLEL